VLGLGLGLRPQNSGLGLGLVGEVLALAFADAVELLYIDSNI